MANLTGLCKWAYVHQPDTTYKPRWTINIVVEDDVKKRLDAAGLIVQQDKDGDDIIKIKRNTTRKDGSNVDPPIVTGPDNEPFNKLIGNGSKVKVDFSVYSWEMKDKRGNSAWLNKVQVLEHVPYEDNDVDFSGESTSSVSGFDDDIPF